MEVIRSDMSEQEIKELAKLMECGFVCEHGFSCRLAAVAILDAGYRKVLPPKEEQK